METRRRLFGALFNFTRKIDVNYACAMVRKSECPDVVALTAKLSKELATILRDNAPFWNRYEQNSGEIPRRSVDQGLSTSTGGNHHFYCKQIIARKF